MRLFARFLGLLPREELATARIRQCLAVCPRLWKVFGSSSDEMEQEVERCLPGASLRLLQLFKFAVRRVGNGVSSPQGEYENLVLLSSSTPEDSIWYLLLTSQVCKRWLRTSLPDRLRRALDHWITADYRQPNGYWQHYRRVYQEKFYAPGSYMAQMRATIECCLGDDVTRSCVKCVAE